MEGKVADAGYGMGVGTKGGIDYSKKNYFYGCLLPILAAPFTCLMSPFRSTPAPERIWEENRKIDEYNAEIDAEIAEKNNEIDEFNKKVKDTVTITMELVD